MSLVHACPQCKGTVFTLEAPRSNIGGARINTGLKLATCMGCGCQDRPIDLEADKEGKLILNKLEAKAKGIAPEPEFNYTRLLSKWLRKFNHYAQGAQDGTKHNGLTGYPYEYDAKYKP